MEGRICNGVDQHSAEIKQQVQKLAEDLKKLAKEQSKKNHDDEFKKSESVQILDQWRITNEESLSRIVRSIHEKDEQLKGQSYQRKVLDTLYFERIEDRQSKIDPKADGTLRWVFNPPTKYQSQWSDMSTWLQGAGGLYWVSGKPGSGKTTLMKWLLDEQRTKKHLESWAGTKRLLIAKYFFWSPGHSLQKSLSGLLRSLLYDLLLQCPESIARISPARWRSYDLNLAHFPAWTDTDLLVAIHCLVQDTLQFARICLFIDGLDECVEKDTQQHKILKLLQELSGLPHIKICVSSRPLEVFKIKLAEYPNLRLELLTRNDVEEYINNELQADDKFKALRQKNDTLCSQLITEILDKAEGVWLWVVIVVRSLLRGLEHGDTAIDLLTRLRQIPSELETYFHQMLSGIEKVYRPRAFMLLKIALNSPSGLTLMTCSFLDEPNQNFAFEVPLMSVPDDRIEQRLKETISRINVRCLGLLETKRLHTDGHLMCQYSVDFLHRTARDFLLDDPGILLEMKSVASFEAHRFVCEAVLAQMKMINTPTKLLLATFIHHAQELEHKASKSSLHLFSHLDEVLYTHRHSPWSKDTLQKGRIHVWTCADEGPLPFLSLSIQFGLDSFAKSSLKSHPRLVSLKRNRPLLDYALRRRIYSIKIGQAEQLELPVDTRDRPDVELVQLILAYGGNPNEQFGGSTVWKFFMRFLDDFGDQIRLLNEDERQHWVEVTELLIRHGAVRVLEREIIVPQQLSGRTRVKLSYHKTLASDSIEAAFGAAEAARLDSLSWWLSITGQNIWTASVRYAHSWRR